jgi:hypothetical protein
MSVDVNKLNYQEFSDKFKQQRENITKSILEYIARTADLKEYISCEIFFHSKRQELVESIHDYMGLVAIFNNEITIRKSTALVDIVENSSNNFNYKSKEEKLILIDGSTMYVQKFIDLFNNQISFLNESKKTIEGIIYNLKSKLELSKYSAVC